MMEGKKIAIGVSGGIAAYKACSLVSKLTQQGAEVRVIMTKNAVNFISPLTFQALSRNEVHTDTFIEKDPKKIAHIDIADWADLFIIAPATANIIGKIANGISDDILTSSLLATMAPIYIAPAMNVHMYLHPAVTKNMQQLEAYGYYFIEPGAGYLACGYIGKGRLEEPEEIIEVINNHQKEHKLFKGKRILISAGPTIEKIDPVRYFTNHSSGKMGYYLAETAANMGANVTLVSGPVSITTHHPNIQVVSVTSSEEMFHALKREFTKTDILIKAAAVADYRPKKTYKNKRKKQPGNWQIEMERTTDILATLAKEKQNQFIVGFAAETNDPIENGKRKLHTKNLDGVVINNIQTKGAGFGHDTNIVTYLNKKDEQVNIPLSHKQTIAKEILQLIDKDLKDETK